MYISFLNWTKLLNKDQIFLEIKKLLYGNGIVSFIGFFTIIYIGRNLPPVEYANFAIALSFFYFFQFTNEPVRMLFAKFVPEYDYLNENGKILGLFYLMIKIITILCALFLTLLLLWGTDLKKIFKLPSSSFLYLILIFLGLKFFLNIGRGIINGKRDYSNFNISFYIESFSRLFIAAIILIFFKTASTTFLSYIIASIIVIPFIFIKIKDIFKYDSQKIKFSAIFPFLKPLLYFSISFMAFYSIDMFMAKAYLTGEGAGYYSAASQLTKAIVIIGSSFNVMLLPHITESFLKNKDTLKDFMKISRLLLWISLAILAVFILFPKQIIYIVYTKRYINASDLILPLGLGTLFMTLSSIIGNYFLAIKKSKILLIPVIFIFIEIALIYFNHNSPQQISYMFALSQFILFILLLIFIFLLNHESLKRKAKHV